MASIVNRPGLAYSNDPLSAAGLLVDAHDYYREFYRAALTAERSILLSGWQFDRNVALLRGADAEAATLPVTLLKFLDTLCEQKPQLQIWILAWDFHLILAAEREWMQRLAFHWMTNERLRFRFDDTHVERGCHHQKFVVIDGELSFLGGLDLCDHRWDDRQHKYTNGLRISRGSPHQPFHDIQIYMRSRAVARSLSKLFSARWERAGGEAPPAEALAPLEEANPFVSRPTLALPARSVAISRTDPNGVPEGAQPCLEIRKLYVSAIESAQRLIYLETQYFSSHVIADCFEARMRSEDRPKLEIVMILNMRGETLKEQAAVGLAQAQIVGRLRQVAEETGHQLGIFYTLPACDAEEEAEKPTFIHSKIMIVDDRFLTVGSANLTNRSMAIDTELNASIEADLPDDELGRAIQEVRGALLGEHSGGPPVRQLDGLVLKLEELAARAAAGARGEPCRLRHHPAPSPEERAALLLIDPQKLPFDPDESDLPSGSDSE